MLTRYTIRLCAIALVACRSDTAALTLSLSPVALGPIMEQVRAVVARDSARWDSALTVAAAAVHRHCADACASLGNV